MVTQAGEFIQALTAKHRVIVIDGLAVIAHGFNRPTKDADVWLDPLKSPEEWARALARICDESAHLSIHTLPGWRKLAGEQEIAEAAEAVGMVRVLGLNCPLDIFRRPNEFPENSFDDVISRSTQNSDGTWLPDPLDLAITKILTDREQDAHDIAFLESKIRTLWIERLPVAPRAEALRMLDRFADWRTCEAALANANDQVRETATSLLKEFADEGDPFSQAVLEGRRIPRLSSS